MHEPGLEAIITPQPDKAKCERMGCDATDLLSLVEPAVQAEARVLCPRHRVEYLREVYNQ